MDLEEIEQLSLKVQIWYLISYQERKEYYEI